MKSYLSLIPISAKIHKRKNRMILTCIILAVFLVTAVFSMADMGIRMQELRAYHDHGNWHIGIKNMTQSDADEINSQGDIAQTAWYDALNYRIDKEYYINGKKALVCGISENFTDLYTGFTKNAYPKNKTEAIISSNLENLYGLKVGDSIMLQSPQKDFKFRVSGIYDNSENLMINDAVGIYVSMEAFNEILAINNEAGEPIYYIQFNKYVNPTEKIDDIKNEFGIADENIINNEMILMLSGMSVDSVVLGFYGVAAVLFILILFAGVLMISSSLNTSVAERSQFFGMLRCIGTSKKQVSRFVKLEALYWCKTAIPIGVGTGVVITWLLCAILHYIVGGEFADIPVFEISAIGIISGIIVGLLAVLLSARVPAKRASKVSPMAAVNGNIGNTNKFNRASNINFGRIETSLGINRSIASKKNLILMTLSFALSIVLFLCFSATLDLVAKLLPAARPSAPDVSICSQNYATTVDRDLISKLNQAPNVKKVFGRMYKGDAKIQSNKNIGKIDLISYEENQFAWAESDCLKGDLSLVASGANYVATDFYEENPLRIGDKIIINGKEMEIAAILGETPFEADGIPLIICSEKTFADITGENNYSIIDVQFTKNAVRSDIENVRNLAGDEYIFSDRWELNRDDLRLYLAFRLFVYGFLLVIALIAAINIINSIGASVSAKIREYGIMRAVGMSTKQVIKMIAAETVTYCVFGIIAGLGIGLPLHKWCYELLVTAHFGTSWQIPIIPILIILLIITAATFTAIYFPSKRIKEISIIDTINEK